MFSPRDGDRIIKYIQSIRPIKENLTEGPPNSTSLTPHNTQSPYPRLYLPQSYCLKYVPQWSPDGSPERALLYLQKEHCILGGQKKKVKTVTHNPPI